MFVLLNFQCWKWESSLSDIYVVTFVALKHNVAKCIQTCLHFEFSHQKYLFLTSFQTDFNFPVRWFESPYETFSNQFFWIIWRSYRSVKLFSWSKIETLSMIFKHCVVELSSFSWPFFELKSFFVNWFSCSDKNVYLQICKKKHLVKWSWQKHFFLQPNIWLE